MLGCDSDGCDRAATTVIAFNKQAGHVHDCDQHTSLLREFADVKKTWPLEEGECPLGCKGESTWTATPRHLE